MKVWVTRDEPNDGPLSTALRQAGLEVLYAPVLTRKILTDAADDIAQLTESDWLVLTSVYAVEAIAAEPAGRPRVAVVGEATNKAAVAKSLRVEHMASDGTGKGLFKELRDMVLTGKVCYPRSSLAAKPQPWDGVELISPVLYETVPRPFDRSVIDEADVVSVASPSAVKAVGDVDIPFASIGPTTSEAIRKLGKEPWVEAPQRSFESLAAAIRDHASKLD